ncbi:hypothetical protein D3C73_1183540 [compost metagenome]
MWLICRSIASLLHWPDSSSALHAIARKPCPHSSTLVLYPSRRKTALTVFSLMGFDTSWSPAKTRSKRPVKGRIASITANAWRDSGTIWGSRILAPRCEYLTPSMGSRDAGIVQIARSISSSSQRMKRNSLERTKVSNVNRTASTVSRRPLYPCSLRRKSGISCSGNAGWCLPLRTDNAPVKSAAGLLSINPVCTA